MATIAILFERKALYRVNVKLDTDEVQKRFIYGFPEFQRWLDDDVRKLDPGRLQAADPPTEQVDYLLYRWLYGQYIVERSQFRILRPLDRYVWEMKTADIRIFGWMYQPLRFVAVFGDYADLYKGSGATRSYADAIQKVVDQRDQLDLDPPKLRPGAFHELVHV